MRILAGITSVKNHRQDMLDKVYFDLAQGGFPSAYISYDDFDNRLGPFGNFRKCLAVLMAQKADAYLIVQDDVRVAHNLRPYLEQTLPENMDHIGAFSIYTAGPHHQNQIGWHKLEPCLGKLAYGACGLLLPHKAAEWFLADGPKEKTRTCFWLAQWCGKTGREYWMHSPSLVCHVGEHSIVNPLFDTATACFPYRQCKHWAPDALELGITIEIQPGQVPSLD